jgi:hypothetical protein
MVFPVILGHGKRAFPDAGTVTGASGQHELRCQVGFTVGAGS